MLKNFLLLLNALLNFSKFINKFMFTYFIKIFINKLEFII